MSAATPIRACVRGAMTPSDEDIRSALLDLAHQRGAGKTFCPSEAARALSDEWRGLMPRVREVAASCDTLRATQKGETVDPIAENGPIRLGLAP